MTVISRQISQHRSFSRFMGFLVIFVLCSLFSINAFPETENTTIYFHSSETNINNFKSLKIKFDNYLLKYGAYEFQPIKDREAFETCINTRKNCLLLLSSWHYRILYKKYNLVPVMMGMRKGKKTQKRILVAPKNMRNDLLTGSKVATASSKAYTQSVLSFMADTSKLTILTVPKDIDALFTVGFGACELALTTEHAFKKLKEINPELYNTIKIVDSCEESYLLIAAVPKSVTSDIRDLCSVMKEMGRNPEGRKNLHMLGLDDWQNVTSVDRTKLEKKHTSKMLHVTE